MNDSLRRARAALKEMADPDRAAHLMRFFKTGKGSYGEHDRFLGIPVPELRRLSTRHAIQEPEEVLPLLTSPWHEERLFALILLVNRFKKADDDIREAIYRCYLGHTAHVNNWDLVDLSASYIVGAWLLDRPHDPLFGLVRSASLWERRIAIVATHAFIRNHRFDTTLALAETLLSDTEDLMHKATGWMLREAGKRDLAPLENFLDRHASRMPRTMLRYAIEKFPEERRRFYLGPGSGK